MEILKTLYQQRLDSLSTTFIKLLQQLEKTLTPFSSPELIGHRFQYLSHIIANTLKDERERFIFTLCQQVHDLTEKLNQFSLDCADQPISRFSKHFSEISTCSLDSGADQQSVKNKSHHHKPSGLGQQLSRGKNLHSLEQTYLDVDDNSTYESDISSIAKKREVGSHSQTSIKLQSNLKKGNLKSRIEPQEVEQAPSFQFKYLKINRF